ncbi:hypothetical protein [Lyngbya confervoides]|uniref:IrrE N-terminal-like domain-containing protein n=1 Tax=Lyngbya confervoides BDU141951 TaxID=1574623 RepID=A0ABD4T0D6_9CYAN|nr:hypothetical protein [Lyngbya confervoides]MCM1981870.1 hypothetical protein [Lyngbya confervoides BDU141951]
MVATVVSPEESRVQGLQTLNLCRMGLEENIGDLTLREGYWAFAKDKQADIPLIIRLLENPASPIALPGSIDLFGHDCLHLLLNRGMDNFDEAFIIGFTMGNARELQKRHLNTFRLVASHFYPPPYRFSEGHLKSFDLGVLYGQRLPFRDIHLVDFSLHLDRSIAQVRELFGISIAELRRVCYAERLWNPLCPIFSLSPGR